LKPFDFFKYDLNLLVAFDALYSERSVTGAAKHVGMGQSGMSHALARLRELFKDPLFARSGSGIVPTAFATQMAEPIRDLLRQAHGLIVNPPRFDTATSEAVFRLAMSDACALVLLPPLIGSVNAVAPGVQVLTESFDRRRVETQLIEGAIDVAIGVFPSTVPRLRSELLFVERHVCLHNPDLIKLRSPISLKDYLAYPHVLMTLAGDAVGVVDPLLSKRGLKRQIIATTPYAYLIPFILQQVKAIAIVPERLVAECSKATKLMMSPPPMRLEGYQVTMVWHPRTDADKGQTWLRDQVRGASKDRDGRRRAR
jgi:LysR family transcriptional regulator, mexEF-oprN operon transcriptional activator